ncbi:MAG: ImmA/IrrE family metallo-endopeptidase [Clostridiales bacterium]|nr:ImmA/IrrE family metallo-endopeptidase [Clostridiales bacterium]
MNTAQKSAKQFLTQLHLRRFTSSDLEGALSLQGYTVVEFSRVSNTSDVAKLLSALGLADYAASQSAFTYADDNLRIVFLLEHLSEQERLVLLEHELGHICCGHMRQGGLQRAGSNILQEQEANDFAACLASHNRRIFPPWLWAGAAVILLCSAALVLILSGNGKAEAKLEEQTVYVTVSGTKYHRADCYYVEGKDNLIALTVEQARQDGYQPCSHCMSDKEE